MGMKAGKTAKKPAKIVAPKTLRFTKKPSPLSQMLHSKTAVPATKPQSTCAGDTWMDKQERSFTRWINHVIRPEAAGFDANRSMFKIQRKSLAIVRAKGFAQVMEKVDAEVEAGRISIRADRNPMVDVGLRDTMVQMLLAYTPVWLRFGLEAVFGGSIKLGGGNKTRPAFSAPLL